MLIAAEYNTRIDSIKYSYLWCRCLLLQGLGEFEEVLTFIKAFGRAKWFCVYSLVVTTLPLLKINIFLTCVSEASFSQKS